MALRGSSKAGDHAFFHQTMGGVKRNYIQLIRDTDNSTLLNNYRSNKKYVETGNERAQQPDYRLYQRLALQELVRRGLGPL